ncbi:MAG: UDP-glucose 4-epimerase GalE [Pseudomonadota bacterium]
MAILVTGGAGYIGAHMLLALEEAGESAVALDDLSHGQEWLAPDGVPLEVCSVGDQTAVIDLLQRYDIDEVVHFAGSTLVQESIATPLPYYRNNTANTLALLEACAAHGVQRFIFSSTASVYGTPERSPINENTPLHPITPYGAAMAMSERILADAAEAHGFSFITLRYFNVAGADPKLRAGQIGKPTHLVRVAAQIACGARSETLQIYGDDYPTPDGTAIRDYVHVSDLADAHVSALARLRSGGASATMNCGYGRGYSVLEVVEAVERVTGRPLQREAAPRRQGDPPQLIADSAAIRSVLDWRPRYDEIDYIVQSAIEWEEKLAARARSVRATSNGAQDDTAQSKGA